MKQLPIVILTVSVKSEIHQTILPHLGLFSHAITDSDEPAIVANKQTSAMAANDGPRKQKAKYEITGLLLRFASTADLISFKKDPAWCFEFSPSGSDNGGVGVISSSNDEPISFDLDASNSHVSLRLDEDECCVEADVEVIFDVFLEGGCDKDRFDEWAENEGGYFTCYVTPANVDADADSDEGQRLYLVE